MHELIRSIKAISDPARVRILMALEERERCVCELTQLLHLAPSTVSRHLSLLSYAGFVRSRREGRWVFFRLASENEMLPFLPGLLQWLRESLSESEEIVADREKLARLDQEDLCRP
ncbi:MAG: winged helix-turn-helix transcriptional regulator [Verrucomicrobia bacterium]|nr:winged helix-turn-helix transcriptional regulator [Verrucomicrobiota bacterium]